MVTFEGQPHTRLSPLYGHSRTNDGIDLIVLATGEHGRVARLMLHSVVDNIVERRHARC